MSIACRFSLGLFLICVRMRTGPSASETDSCTLLFFDVVNSMDPPPMSMMSVFLFLRSCTLEIARKPSFASRCGVMIVSCMPVRSEMRLMSSVAFLVFLRALVAIALTFFGLIWCRSILRLICTKASVTSEIVCVVSVPVSKASLPMRTG